VLSNITMTGGVGSFFLSWTLPDATTVPDYKGVLVWASLTSGFTPSQANLIWDGSDSNMSFKALGPGTHYVKVAAYDTFGKDYTGAGLNVSGQYSAVQAGTGIAPASTLPGTGNEGDIIYNTTDGKLYRYHAGAWTAAVQAVDVSGTFSAAQIASVAASSITGSIADTQLAAISAAKVTGQLVDSQLAAIGVGKLVGLITGNQVAANTITTNNLQTGSVTTGILAAGAVTTNILAAGAVTALNLAAGSVSAGKLVVTGQGKALNADPTMTDITAWNIVAGTGAVQLNSSTASPGGANVIALTGTGGGEHMTSLPFPVQAGKTYKVSVWVKSTATAGSLYIRMPTQTYNGTATSDYVVTNVLGGNFEGNTVPTAWTNYVGFITPSTNAVAAYLEIYSNWAAGSNTTYVSDFRCEEYIGADLIVNGSIIGTKIAALTITGNNIQAGTLTSDKLYVGSVQASLIQGNNIAAQTVSASNIVSNTLTATQIATNGITTPCINGGAVCQLRNTAYNSGGTTSFNQTSTDPTGTTYTYLITQTSSYTTYCYGSREVKLVGFDGTWYYHQTQYDTTYSPPGTYNWNSVHPAMAVRRVVNGVATIIWSTDYTGSSTAALGNTGGGTMPYPGSASDIVILDDTSLGSPGTAVSLYYDVVFIGTQLTTYSPGVTKADVGITFPARTYAGQRFISMVEYQK